MNTEIDMTMPTHEDQQSIVFYSRQDFGDHEYHFFVHEADVLLGTIANLVFDGDLEPAEGFRLWERYRDLEPSLYDNPDDWDGGFPGATGEFEPFVSEIFYEECLATGLDGVRDNIQGASPASGRIFEVRDDEALQKVSEKLRGRYIFVHRDEPDYMYPRTVDEAERLISAARVRSLGP